MNDYDIIVKIYDILVLWFVFNGSFNPPDNETNVDKNSYQPVF